MTETLDRAQINYGKIGKAWAVLNEHASHIDGEVANANTDQLMLVSQLHNELATLRAQLAGVRERVEKLDRYDPIVDCNEPYMEHTERGDYFSCADVLAALGGDA